jgi:hypothetical protein
MDKAKRKRRNDRRHAVYCITNALTGERYIGITVCQGAAVKRSLKIRWQKHVRRAVTEDKNWSLCRSIREWGAECFVMELLETIRGRKPAHQRERELIRKLAPELNTF